MDRPHESALDRGFSAPVIIADLLLESYSCLRRACDRILRPRGDDAKSHEILFRELQYRELAGLLVGMFPGIDRLDSDDGLPWQEPDDFEAADAQFRRAAKLREPIAGGWVRSGHCLAYVPLLLPEGSTEGDAEWTLYLLSAAARTKERHRREAAYTYCCLKDAGINAARVVLVSVNRSFVRSGEVQAHALFQQEECTAWVHVHETEVRARIASILDAVDLLASGKPGAEELPLCRRPFDCRVCSTTFANVPAHHVYTLYRGGETARSLLGEGITDLAAAPAGLRLTTEQEIQIDTVRRGAPHVRADRLREFLSRLEYPLSFLDFETYAVAVPPFDGIRPWQHVPFQYSVHRLAAAAALPEQFGYIEATGTDGRFVLTQSLLSALGQRGSVVVFGSNFERSMLSYLGQLYPEFHAQVSAVGERIVDLSRPFQRFDYYHPGQRGRMSLKMILPALTGYDYSDLEFADGLDASVAYYLSSHAAREGAGVYPTAKVAGIRDGLEKYCAMDTMALIRILQVLYAAAAE